MAGSVLHTLEHGCTTAGRKSGKGCYVYAGRKKSINSQAENVLKKYTIENKGRYVLASCDIALRSCDPQS